MESVPPGYDVFINHRGPDVKKTLASLIYRDLKRYKLKVFLDNQELQTGDTISPAIIKAIQSAPVHIAIFSETYAKSTWCLDELLWMLDCPDRKIIPIFYDTKPSDLRYIESGAYAHHFQEHRNKGRVEIQLVEKWIKALNEVSHVSGLVYRNGTDDLGELLDSIVEDVLKEMRRDELDLGEYAVGLHQAAERFQKEALDRTELNEVKVVGIVGLGGSGKSTLVAHLYNSKRSQFRRSCFLSDVSKKDLPSLQQILLRNLFSDQNLYIDNMFEGRTLFRKHLRGFPPVLIVFDGITNREQIDNLLFVKDVVGNGSLILVTLRDRDLFAPSEIEMYDIRLLDEKDAQVLFCWHAFHRPKPPINFQDLVEELVQMCAGFPLAIKVLAGVLSGNRDRSYWMRKLETFRKQLPNDILDKVVKVSYQSLNSKEKEGFLDIAHFLVGEDSDLVEVVLDGMDNGGFDCLETLQQKCLIEFESADIIHRRCTSIPSSELGDDENLFYYLMEPWEIRKKETCSIEVWRREKGSLRIKMHDLVRDIARQIGREESPLRLCCSNDSSISTRVQSEPYRVQGIRRDGGHQLPVFLQHQDICALKLLAVQNSTLLRHFNSVSGELIWLRLCESDCNGIPSSLSLRNLRVLELGGVSPRDFQYLFDNCECPRQLHELTISCTGKYETTIQSQIPVLPPTSSEKSESTSQSSDFGKWFRQGLGNLAKLVLQNIDGFQSLPIEFEKLRNLRHLDLSGCSDLAALPDSFTKLLHLQYLALQGCRQLVLQDLGEISKLEYLSFEGCSSLAKLPRGTGLQNSLKYLNILHTQLEKLPEHLEQLENLKVMHIGSSKLTKFPSSLYNLDSLTDLTLIGCTNLFVIDKSFERLLHLECFRVYSCGVKALPEGMVWMNIKFLDVQECPLESGQLLIGVESGNMPLDGFGQLATKAVHRNQISCLTNLIIRRSNISEVNISPAKCLFPNLEIVDLSSNSKLIGIASLPENLIRLNLKNCMALRALACLRNATNLKFLDISGCYSLETVNMEGLSTIEVIKADECWSLKSFEGLSHLQKLSHFQISTGQTHENLNYIWRDILMFPANTSTFLCRLPMFINVEKVEEMDRAAHSFEDVTVKDMTSVELEGTAFAVELKGATLLCLITDGHCNFEVTLLGRASTTSYHCGSQHKYSVHLLMWTKNSDELKDISFSSDEGLYCSIKRLNPENGLNHKLRKGWMLSAKNSEVCKQFLRSLLIFSSRKGLARGDPFSQDSILR